MSEHIVIVGGVAGGATAAARARRISEKAEITLIERGPYVSLRQLRTSLLYLRRYREALEAPPPDSGGASTRAME